ncbi:Piso0_005259 [Millerozyma farinosa CBS 7064]|uniref:Piso0_005259 protein n=1 Tax=Pichia sorbitophila (strain ATCC MYA-4447 / BCRC 22081 / CBS 7064 / NBRC 10061 / NRRL Y-12695) TaxID=559304 RepID=G8Y1P6_PICSO|nr:Piso0_005259 [Millerozyma farinosa CBS 7064]
MTVEDLREELTAIDAIYPGCIEEVGPQIFNLSPPGDDELIIELSFPLDYPDIKPDVIAVVSKNPSKYPDERYLEKSVNDIVLKVFRKGEVCLFDLFTELEEFLYKYESNQNENPETASGTNEEVNKAEEPDTHETQETDHFIDRKTFDIQVKDPLEGWTQSDPIVDRGSTFVGFARQVHSVEDAENYLEILKTDRKISKANHNMLSWRIKRDDGVQYQDCDDDGETAAGGRILHLLTMMDAWNVIVVVSRWFGGTHIGPDRFKHINSAARDAVIKGNFVAADKNSTGKKKKKK